MDESVICPPLDYIQVFSSKLTSDSSILLKKKSSEALFSLRSLSKRCRRLPQSRDSRGVGGILITPMH